MFLLALQVPELKGPLLLDLGRNESGRSDGVLSLVSNLSFQLMGSDLPVLHDLLSDLAAADTSAGAVADGAILVATIELEVFDALEDLLIQLLFDDLSLDDCVGRDRVILVELFVDFIDLDGLDLVLLLPDDLTSDFVVDLVDGVADREVYFPEDALDESAHDSHQDEVHEDEENYDCRVVAGVPPAVIVGDGRPASLRQYLHHHILGVDEGFEVGKLDVFVVIGCILDEL